MRCPHCKKEIHINRRLDCAYEDANKSSFETCFGFGTESGICPSCSKLIVFYVEGKFYSDFGEGDSIWKPYYYECLIYPQSKNNFEISDEVPKEYRQDFDEAIKVIEISPKSSAALSRRCLQNLFHNYLNISDKSLASEIDKFINLSNVPSYILEAVDAIRNIGNFAAHPIKDKNTGVIVDVEEGEAEWLLEVLRLLFDFYFTMPKIHEKRKNTLNEKLLKLGKREMKTI